MADTRTAGGAGVRGVTLSTLSWGANRIILFLLTLALARLLTPEDFGIVTAGLTVMIFLEVGLDLGVGSTIVYEQEQGITDRVRSAFTLNLLTSGLVTLAFVAAAPAVARFFGVADVAVFRVLFCYPLLHGAGQVHDALLKRDLRFKARMLVDLLRASTRVAVTIPLALSGFGVWSIVWGLLASEAVGTLTNWSLVRLRPSLSITRATAMSLLHFGVALVAVRVVNAFQVNADYLVVGNRLGLEALGIYTVAYRLPELLLSNLYWVFTTVAFPIYSRARATSLEALRRTALRALMLLSLFGFSVGVGLAIVARDAVLVLFSERWVPAAAPMTLISLGLAAMAVAPACGDVLPAIGRPGMLLPLQIPAVALSVLGFVAVADLGMTAVAAVHLVYGIAFATVHVVVAMRLLQAGVRDILRALRPGLCAATGIAVAALPVRLALEPGLAALVATVVAGALGAAAAIAIGSRSTFTELRLVVGQALDR